MDTYKVLFHNNVAQSAEQVVRVDYRKIANIVIENDHKYMEWLIVCGRDEQHALENASNLVDTFWGGYLQIKPSQVHNQVA